MIQNNLFKETKYPLMFAYLMPLVHFHIIEEDHIQSGPGMAEGSDGKVYISYFFMKIHD